MLRTEATRSFHHDNGTTGAIFQHRGLEIFVNVRGLFFLTSFVVWLSIFSCCMTNVVVVWQRHWCESLNCVLGQITDIGRCSSCKKTDIKQAQEGLKKPQRYFILNDWKNGSTELSENNAKLLDNIIRVTENSHFKTGHLSLFVKFCHDVTVYKGWCTLWG